jgi:hypothetical protein
VKNGVLHRARETESPMPNDSPRWRRPGVRLRHDMHLWIRHDAARFVRPGFDPADVFPTLARERAQKEAAKERARAAEDAAFDAWIEGQRRVLAALRAEVDELKAARARQRLEEAKYSPSQPRVPAGNPRGGQWTDRSGGQSTVAGPSPDTGQSQDADLTQPMGNVDIADVSGSSELGDLFHIKPDDTRIDGVRLAANDTPDDPTPVRDPTPIREAAPLVDPAPKIPLTRPETSAERTDYMRAAANWLLRMAQRPPGHHCGLSR